MAVKKLFLTMRGAYQLLSLLEKRFGGLKFEVCGLKLYHCSKASVCSFLGPMLALSGDKTLVALYSSSYWELWRKKR